MYYINKYLLLRINIKYIYINIKNTYIPCVTESKLILKDVLVKPGGTTHFGSPTLAFHLIKYQNEQLISDQLL